MITRTLEYNLKEVGKFFPVISLTGPRQSGKTTLLKKVFSDFLYCSLEDPDHRIAAENDPRKFLNQSKAGIIIDEAQKAPELFSYIQGIVDDDKKRKFVLSGSQNFLLSEKISQTLAGRVGILKLLPLSIGELKMEKLFSNNFETAAWNGFYPALYDRKIPPGYFYSGYIQTYVERDVREMKNIGSLNDFIRFLKLCAGRAGQLLNYSSIAGDAGISVPTVKSWISILEASYILFPIYPHYKNFSKRLVKMPKLYFYDTGLLCYLLDIENENNLKTHYARGAIFENLVISEMIKKRFNNGQTNNLFFWRDHRGKEIDCIIEKGEQLTPVELKSGMTKREDYFDSITYWNKLSGNSIENSYVIYGGDETTDNTNGKLISWKDTDQYPG